MKIVKASEVGECAIEKMLTKASFDEVELSPKIREANKKTFGRDMTAAELARQIVGDVRREGDAAVIRYTSLIDRVDYKPGDFLVTEAEYEAAEKAADPAVVESLRKAAENVRRYHQEQKPNSWMTYREKGSILGQSIIPLDRVGIYVPGGTAAYPSSVIMNAVPASVAGVGEIIMMVPSGQHLRYAGQERGLRPCRHRHARRAERDPHRRRQDGGSCLHGGRHAEPGRARPAGFEHRHHGR